MSEKQFFRVTYDNPENFINLKLEDGKLEIADSEMTISEPELLDFQDAYQLLSVKERYTRYFIERKGRNPKLPSKWSRSINNIPNGYLTYEAAFDEMLIHANTLKGSLMYRVVEVEVNG